MSKKQPSPAAVPEVLFDRVAAILEQARGNVVRAVNTNMVHAYWLTWSHYRALMRVDNVEAPKSLNRHQGRQLEVINVPSVLFLVASTL